jgi:deoxyribodipyrimidine photolyase
VWTGRQLQPPPSTNTTLNTRSLRARGSRLIVLRGSPEEVLPRALKGWNATHLWFEADTEPYARARDARVSAAATEAGVQVASVTSHTLYVSLGNNMGGCWAALFVESSPRAKNTPQHMSENKQNQTKPNQTKNLSRFCSWN